MRNEFNIKIDYFISRMFKKRYSGNQLTDWEEKSFFSGGTIDLYKSFIKTLLEDGYNIKTGYRISSKIRGEKTFYIFYKKSK